MIRQKHSCVYHFHCVRPEIHSQISWTIELCNQIHHLPYAVLFRVNHQTAFIRFNNGLTYKFKPLQLWSVVHLIDPWQVAQKYAVRILVVLTIQTSSSETYRNLIQRGVPDPIRSEITSIVSRYPHEVQGILLYLIHWLLNNTLLTLYRLLGWHFFLLTQ